MLSEEVTVEARDVTQSIELQAVPLVWTCNAVGARKAPRQPPTKPRASNKTEEEKGTGRPASRSGEAQQRRTGTPQPQPRPPLRNQTPREQKQMPLPRPRRWPSFAKPGARNKTEDKKGTSRPVSRSEA